VYQGFNTGEVYEVAQLHAGDGVSPVPCFLTSDFTLVSKKMGGHPILCKLLACMCTQWYVLVHINVLVHIYTYMYVLVRICMIWYIYACICMFWYIYARICIILHHIACSRLTFFRLQCHWDASTTMYDLNLAAGLLWV
jgi:hypothetical protein